MVPISGLTIPRAEMNGLVMGTRELEIMIDSLEIPAIRVSVIGDSTCTISSVEATASVLAVYFANRVAEVTETLQKMNTYRGEPVDLFEEITDKDNGVLVDPLAHIAGTENIADLPTRPHASVDDVNAGSAWQDGPAFLRMPRSKWPVTRDFIREVPEAEKRSKLYQLISNVQLEPYVDTEGKRKEVERILYYSDKLSMVKGIMARYVRAHRTGDRSSILLPLEDADFKEAMKVMLWMSMPMTCQLYHDGKLTSLAPFWGEGILWTRGRISEDSLSQVLAVKQLAILHPDSRMAFLVMKKSHEEDHRLNYQDSVWRSRKYAWIPHATNLAKRIISDCQSCRVRSTTLQQQRIGDLPKEALEVPCRPYTNITMDFMGPFWTIHPENKRKNKKVFVLVICCLNTGAVTARVCEGYSTKDFLTAFFHHIADHMAPKWIYTDAGSQLKAGKKVLAVDEELPDIDWSKVMSETSSQEITWRVAPAQCQHRNGLSEAAVNSFKKTIKWMSRGVRLETAEFALLLARACFAINGRPLGVRFRNKALAGYAPITPNMLIFGPDCEETEELAADFDALGNLASRLKMLQIQFQSWWKQWFLNVFDQLMPLPKWKTEHRNLKVGDICLLSYSSKIPPAHYRLCRITKVFHDKNLLVRDVEVSMRPRRKTEKILPYQPKPLAKMVVGIQRLVLICPVEDIKPEDQQVDEAASEAAQDLNHVEVWPQPSEMWHEELVQRDPGFHCSLVLVADPVDSLLESSTAASDPLALTRDPLSASHSVSIVTSTTTHDILSEALNDLDMSPIHELSDPEDVDTVVASVQAECHGKDCVAMDQVGHVYQHVDLSVYDIKD